jgi:hypothetical protein
MNELIIYAILFLMLIGHTGMAAKMYQKVQDDQSLTMKEKNEWKLKALVFPAYFWSKYKKQGNGSLTK